MTTQPDDIEPAPDEDRRAFLRRAALVASGAVGSVAALKVVEAAAGGAVSAQTLDPDCTVPPTTVPATTVPATTIPATTTTLPAPTTSDLPSTTVPPSVPPGGVVRWSDGGWWPGGVPGSSSRVVIDRPVLLDVDAAVAGVTIAQGGELHFESGRSRTLTSSGNVVVMGKLVMTPASASVDHVLRFVGIDDDAFVGGGMQVLDSDVGLWCMGPGLLELRGSPKTAWVRASESVERGARSVRLNAEPSGWRSGDELVLTPTAPPEHASHMGFDAVACGGVSGRTVALGSSAGHPHPVAAVGPGMAPLGCEVLNLSRNVRIEGTPSGRAHVIVMSNRPQDIRYVGIRYMGPRQAVSTYREGVKGRYGLHLHMQEDASRGTRVLGVVVRDTDNHAFVTHTSHGVTLRSCISHNTADSAYWWDHRANNKIRNGPETDDVVYDGCVASQVWSDGHLGGFRLAGFELLPGSGQEAINCVAVGVRGAHGAAGYVWPEAGSGLWRFDGNVSHNNSQNGIFTWLNDHGAHLIENFVCYRNGRWGIEHGAYRNQFKYINGYLYDNRWEPIRLHALSIFDGPIEFSRLHCDANGRDLFGIALAHHRVRSEVPVRVSGCDFVGHSKQTMGAKYSEGTGGQAELIDIIDCTTTTPWIYLTEETFPGALIRVQELDDDAWEARPAGEGASFYAPWNCDRTEIGAFHTGQTPRVQPFTLQAIAPTS